MKRERWALGWHLRKSLRTDSGSSMSSYRDTSGNMFVKTGGQGGLLKALQWCCKLHHVPLTDGLRLQEHSGAAFTFTLAVDGWQLHFVAGVWLQAGDGYLAGGACYNIRGSCKTPWSFWVRTENKRISCSNNIRVINSCTSKHWLAQSSFHSNNV